MKNIIKRILSKSTQNEQIEQATTKIKDKLNQAENSLNELAEGGSGENIPNPYLRVGMSMLVH